MSKIGSIFIEWNQKGEITCKRDFNIDDNEGAFALGGVALVDHLLSTLTSENVIRFCEIVLRRLVNYSNIVGPINSELQSASLEFHRGNALYTLFKSKSKIFCDNQKLEQAIIQMSQNYIDKILVTATKVNIDSMKFGIYGVAACYEQNIRMMHEQKRTVMMTRTNLATVVALFINRFPYGVKPEDLESHMSDIDNLITNLKKLPRLQNKTLLNS